MLLEKIKQQSIEARKQKLPESAFLVTLLGEATRPGKDKGNRPSTDDEVISVMKKFKAGAEEMLGYAIQGNDAVKQIEIQRELSILKSYLPTLMSEQELDEKIKEIISFGNTQIGAIMGQLKAKYAGLYDGKMASDIIKKHV